MTTAHNKPLLKKPILISLAIILLVGLLCILDVYGLNGNIFGWSANSRKGLSPATTTTTTQPTSATANNSAQSAQSSPTTKTNVGSDQPQPPATQSDGTQVVNIAITSTSQTPTSYHLGVEIYSVQNSGSCTLTLSKPGSTTITQTVGVQALPSSSTCKGFEIPMSELTAGSWQASIALSSPPSVGSTTQSIKVN